MLEIAKAVEKDAAIDRICQRYKAPLRTIIGHNGKTPFFNENCTPTLAIFPGEIPYDVGNTKLPERVLPISLYWAVFDKTSNDDGRRITYEGVLAIDELGMAILDAIRGIEGLGDEVGEAAYLVDSSESWPLCLGSCDLVFRMARGTDFEPEIT